MHIRSFSYPWNKNLPKEGTSIPPTYKISLEERKILHCVSFNNDVGSYISIAAGLELTH